MQVCDVYVCMYVVGVGQNKTLLFSGPKKRVTGVRYGLRAITLERITNERRPRSEVRRKEGRAAAVDEAPHFA